MEKFKDKKRLPSNEFVGMRLLSEPLGPKVSRVLVWLLMGLKVPILRRRRWFYRFD